MISYSEASQSSSIKALTSKSLYFHKMVRVERLGNPNGSEELGHDMHLKTLNSIIYLCSIDSFAASCVLLNNYSVKDRKVKYFTRSSIFYFLTVENE